MSSESRKAASYPLFGQDTQCLDTGFVHNGTMSITEIYVVSLTCKYLFCLKLHTFNIAACLYLNSCVKYLNTPYCLYSGSERVFIKGLVANSCVSECVCVCISSSWTQVSWW